MYEYDYLGRLIYEECLATGEKETNGFLSSKSYRYNGFRCTSEEDSHEIKHYSFDPAGRLAAIKRSGIKYTATNPDSRLTEFSHDSFGRIKESKVWFDAGPQDYALECYTYDLAGNIVEKRVEDATNTTLLQRFYTYNLQDQCEEEYFFENGVKRTIVKTVYNAQGEAVSYIDGFGHETKVIINHHYANTLGQAVLKKTLLNPLGIKTEMEFDALGRLYVLSKTDSSGVLLSSQKHYYDALGNRTSEVHDKVINGKIVDFQKTAWTYGPMGRLEEEIQAVNSPLSKTVRYEYNTNGKLIKKIAGESSIQYAYSKDGNIQKIESTTSKKGLRVSNTYSYDRKGNITEAKSLEKTSIKRSYNPFGQLKKEVIKDGEGTYTLEYIYDRKGRLKTIILPDESKIGYTYDAVFGRAVKRISPQGEVLYTHTYESYDLQGALTSENHIGYVGSHDYTYDLNGQKISSKSDYFQEEYSRDAMGRTVEIKKENSEQYGYNGLSQLISEKKQTHTYDSLDNRVQTNNDVLVYNALNQLISHANAEFSYDTQGNLLRKVLEGEETLYEANALSQLISIHQPDQPSVQFSYDPTGRLLVERHLNAKEVNQKPVSTIRYLYFGHQEIGTISASGTIENLKIPGLHGGKLSPKSIAFEIKGDVYVPIHDISGNVVRLVDPENRQVIESYEYTAFGKVAIVDTRGCQVKTSQVGNPWQFAEKRIHEKSGYIVYGYRFYDPNTGRWISQDPMGCLDGPNRYSYLHNNPLSNLDRFGLVTESNSQNQFEEYMYGEVEPHCFCEKHRTCKRGGDIGKTVGREFPKIKYEDDFEAILKDYYYEDMTLAGSFDSSTYYDLSNFGLPELPADLEIGFINGIWNDFSGAKESADYISRLAGGHNVHAVFNATHGHLDLYECVMGLNYTATEPVRLLHKMWDSYFEKSSANAKFLMICHSQGAIHVRNALLDYPPELRERILVVAIAPAAYIYKETCAKAYHYRAEWWRDIVPRFDGSGAEREMETIFTLPSDPTASSFDHEFMSRTYQKKLKKHIDTYIESKGEFF